jgi:hypothetical protein
MAGVFGTREVEQECARCGATDAAGHGRVEPTEGRWVCRRCCARLAAPVVQRASTCAAPPHSSCTPGRPAHAHRQRTDPFASCTTHTWVPPPPPFLNRLIARTRDTGRKRGSHTIILRELGFLQSQQDVRRGEKRQRHEQARRRGASSVVSAAVDSTVHTPAARAAATGGGRGGDAAQPQPASDSGPRNREGQPRTAEGLLAAIRRCCTYRGSAGGGDAGGSDAREATRLAQRLCVRGDWTGLTQEVLRDMLGAACRVGRMRLVRAYETSLFATGTHVPCVDAAPMPGNAPTCVCC